MAFCNKLSGLLRQGVSQTNGLSPSMLASLCSMSTSRLFVGGLSWGTDDQSLKEAFSSYGDVTDARVITDRETGRSRGFGFVNFADEESASSAMSSMDGQDFRVAGVSLTDEAFGFLSISIEEEVESSVMVLVKILKEANGICYRSCIETLIKTLCALSSFDAAKIVIEMSNREAVYYNVFVRECCLKGHFQEARDALCEMRGIGYSPDVRNYNYLISCLLEHQRDDEACIVLKEMREIGCHPNAITYEVLICQSCKGEDLEKAVKLYQIMVFNGVEPRFSTCSAIIQAYFDSQKCDKAYEYVVHVCLSQRWLTNRVYSFLANLHRKHGNYVVAYDLLMELIQNGLKPDFEVYVKLSKDLYKSRKKDLARFLKDGFNSLVHQSSKK